MADWVLLLALFRKLMTGLEDGSDPRFMFSAPCQPRSPQRGNWTSNAGICLGMTFLPEPDSTVKPQGSTCRAKNPGIKFGHYVTMSHKVFLWMHGSLSATSMLHKWNCDGHLHAFCKTHRRPRPVVHLLGQQRSQARLWWVPPGQDLRAKYDRS